MTFKFVPFTLYHFLWQWFHSFSFNLIHKFALSLPLIHHFFCCLVLFFKYKLILHRLKRGAISWGQTIKGEIRYLIRFFEFGLSQNGLKIAQYRSQFTFFDSLFTIRFSRDIGQKCNPFSCFWLVFCFGFRYSSLQVNGTSAAPGYQIWREWLNWGRMLGCEFYTAVWEHRLCLRFTLSDCDSPSMYTRPHIPYIRDMRAFFRLWHFYRS